MMSDSKLLRDVETYYSSKIRRYGISAEGVDWNSEDSQNLRFVQLLKVINIESTFSLLDYGCGYGAVLNILNEHYRDVKYTGFDISLEMLERGKELFGEGDIRWASVLKDEKFDFTIASGIFSVKLNHHDEEWLEYILNTLQDLDKKSVKGFSFNMLTKYSDKEKMRDNLYYADPAYIMDYCKLNFSKYIAVLHDYPLYEFTVIVRKIL